MDVKNKLKCRVIWPKEAEGVLVEKIQEFPVLWDARHLLYSKKSFKRQQLQMLAQLIMELIPGFKVTPDDVRNKFNNLKNYYQKEKRRHSQPSGSGGIVAPKWEWFTALSFLDPVVTPGASICNLNPLLSNTLNEESQAAEDLFTIEIDQSDIVNLTGDIDDFAVPDDPVVSSIQDENNKKRQPPEPLTSTPKRKRTRKRLEENSTAAALETLQKTMQQEQDFAYGAGIMIVSRLRKLSDRKQSEFIIKAMNLLDQLANNDNINTGNDTENELR